MKYIVTIPPAINVTEPIAVEANSPLHALIQALRPTVWTEDEWRMDDATALAEDKADG